MRYRFVAFIKYAVPFLLLGLNSCKSEEKLPDIEKNLAGPVTLLNSPSGNYFYALNSDYERRYNKGSLLIIDPAAAAGAQKVNAIETRRMGQSMTIGQNLLLAAFADDRQGSDDRGEDRGHIEIWSLADEKNPVLIAEAEINCFPVGTAIAASSPYFAVTCSDGKVWLGKNPQNTSANPMTLDYARDYGYGHRALYFYENGSKTWLLGFPSQQSIPENGDSALLDEKHVVINGDTEEMVPGPNGVPDGFEDTLEYRRRLDLQAPYQMFVIPVSDEDALSASEHTAESSYRSFRFVALASVAKPSAANKELRYVFFNLLDSNGLPNGTDGTVDPYNRVYRTNFWLAKKGLEGDSKIFYLSQRGTTYGSASNNVLRLTIDDAALANPDAIFDQIFRVERVYGFKIDRDNAGRYPGSFDLAFADGEPVLLVNHFRDSIDYAGAPFYSISRKFLAGPQAEYESASSVDSTDFMASYFDVAVSASQGKILTASFYGNELFLFDLNPKLSLKDQIPRLVQ